MSTPKDDRELIDVHQVIAEVAARHNLYLEPDDPAIALVTMNQLVLEAAIEAITSEVRETIADFEASMEKAERRAGSVLAQNVKDSAQQVQETLQSDVQVAGLKARELVHMVDRAHRRPALLRWGALGLLAGAMLFAAGVWVGSMLR